MIWLWWPCRGMARNSWSMTRNQKTRQKCIHISARQTPLELQKSNMKLEILTITSALTK